MPDDDRNHPDTIEGPSTDRPASARTGWGVVSSAVLALLAAGTCWVVATWASAWLVPPYLILMAWILLPAAGHPQSGGPAGTGPDPSDALGPAPSAEAPVDRPAPEATDAPAGVSVGADPAAESTLTKGRRGKGKARKGKAIAESREVTWVEVAPGKFVRVEAPRPSAEAGPHEFLGIPVEVPATPRTQSSPEPAEDALPSFEPIEGLGGDPAGRDVASGSPTDPGFIEAIETPEGFGGLPAADGIAPQAEEPFEEIEADWPFGEFRAEPPGSEALDEAGGPPGWDAGERAETPEADDESPPDDPEPTARPPLADMMPEDADESMAADEGDDPTETAVDETVLDDAGPLAGALEIIEIPPADDPTTPDAPQGIPEGPAWWPRRLAPRAATRAGSDPRAPSNAVPPRRPVRSRGPSRRPPDPRRLTRRGARRARQITRTFPPRSPPRGRSVAEGRDRG